MKKKIAIIVISFVLLLLILVIASPFLFRGKIIHIVKNEANKSLVAFVDFNENISISIIKDFPNLHIRVNDLLVVNKEPFLGDTLANIERIDVSLNLLNAIKGKLKINKLHIDRAKIYLHTFSDSLVSYANWDITLPSEDTTETAVISLPVKKYSITNSHIIYNDEAGGIYIEALGLNHSGSGDFSLELFDLVTETTIDETSFRYDGITWISRAKTTLDAVLQIDLVNYKYSFSDNELLLNDFPLSFDGYVAMPEDDIEMKLSFSSPQTDFKHLISLIPAIYMNDFENIVARGSMSFDGMVDGIYGNESLPAFNIGLKVNNGYFKYPDLPEEVKDVFIDMNIVNPDGIEDHTVINISRMQASLGQEPFQLSMLIKTPFSDPYIKTSIKGKLNLGNVKNYVKLDQKIELEGLLDADLDIEGSLSYLEKEQYESFIAKGLLNIQSLKYYYEEMNKTILMPVLNMEFTSRYVEVREMKMKIDKNDIEATGRIQNFIPYFFGKGVLSGKLDIRSDYLNINDFLSDDEPAAASKVTEASPSSSTLTLFELPHDIDFEMTATVKKMLYSKMDLSNVVCRIRLKDGKLFVDDLRAAIFNGSISTNGYYESISDQKANAFFKVDVRNISMKEAYNTFAFVSKYMAIAKFAEGNINGNFEINSPLGGDMMPVFDQLFSKGVLNIKDMKVMNFAPLNSLSEATQMPQYQNVTVRDIKPSFKIENGMFELQPVSFKIDKTLFNVKGINGLDRSMIYEIRMDVPSEDIRKQSSNWLGKMGTRLEEIPMGELIPLFVYLTGTIDKPKVRTSMKSTAKSVVDAGKERAMHEADKAKQEAEARARAEADRQKQLLEQKAREEEERLRRELERKKKEAEEKARQEAERKKKELEEEAKKKLRDVLR